MSKNINVLVLCASDESIKNKKGEKIVIACMQTLNKLYSDQSDYEITFYYTGVRLDDIRLGNSGVLNDSSNGKNITIKYKILDKHFRDLNKLDTNKLIEEIPSKFNFILNEHCPRGEVNQIFMGIEPDEDNKNFIGIKPDQLNKIIKNLLLLNGYYIDTTGSNEKFNKSYKIYNELEEVKRVIIDLHTLSRNRNWTIFQLRPDVKKSLAIEIAKRASAEADKAAATAKAAMEALQLATDKLNVATADNKVKAHEAALAAEKKMKIAIEKNKIASANALEAANNVSNYDNKKSLKGGKTRKAPSESATKYKVGTRKLGNDGNIWIIKKTSNGIQRWTKVKNNSTKKIKSKPNNKTLTKKDYNKKSRFKR